MMRISAFIMVLLVGFVVGPMISLAQEIREAPTARQNIRPNGALPGPGQRLRVPDQFFRHDQARDAVRSGNILSLSAIRRAVSSQYPGKIVDVRLLVPKRQGMSYLYDVRVLTRGGKLLSVTVDAQNAKILDVKG
ncbi:PepSY domain-containing protein [Pseudemcibacter aquimaris]|uniref:PepSY domain-containing protein n=1 Tax=Pseudemcibacter aquimaris TaxID=2857064 RepID=UPI002012F422|nr:hypothetical protein [Pseudemcibacter aquimaris]MCC3862390.1 hypothetical protein [Pseudemcibacter aquimaris]WDU59180.1 hypothetical protein KW060_02715 [Pseudemcibacter aquimaris]